MSDLISRSALLKELKEELENKSPHLTERENDFIDVGLRIAKRATKRIPAVDAVPVVHGRWLRILRGNYECSVCRCIPYYASSISTLNYCPNCGADLRGDPE